MVPELTEPSRFAEDVRACLRVMFSLVLLISSISCTPSGGLGFFSLIYRSRCRPREDDVKFVRQYGHVLSFEAEGLAGVPDSPVEPGVAIETSAMIAREDLCAMRVAFTGSYGMPPVLRLRRRTVRSFMTQNNNRRMDWRVGYRRLIELELGLADWLRGAAGRSFT